MEKEIPAITAMETATVGEGNNKKNSKSGWHG